MTAIAGIKSRASRSELLGAAFLRNPINKTRMSRQVTLTITALDRLDAIGDGQALRASLIANYQLLAGLGYDGRLYVTPPPDVDFESFLEIVDKARPVGVDSAYRYPNYWTPGIHKNGVTKTELDGVSDDVQARIALYSSDQADYADPILHYRNVAFDDKYRIAGEPTQLELVENEQKQFVTAHAGANLRAADHRDFLMWALMDRLAGVDPSSETFVLNRGFMRVPVLGRRTVGGVSCVGGVYSSGGRLGFDGDVGGAGGEFGFGLSAGFEEA